MYKNNNIIMFMLSLYYIVFSHYDFSNVYMLVVQVEEASMTKFESMEKAMKEKVRWDGLISRPSNYVEKWRLMLWTKNILTHL